MHHVDLALTLLLKEVESLSIARIYTLAWEGGHADHDATHLVALALARRLQPPHGVWEFSMYNGLGVPGRFFRTMRLLESSASVERERFTLKDAIRYTAACFAYRSQRKTWLGLFWEMSIRRIVLREMIVQEADATRLDRRPHAGRLLYERMSRVTYDDFVTATASFVQREIARQ